ncbi:MAG: hypothetical protein ACREFY_00600 [Acetobacteraceae bacterium]
MTDSKVDLTVPIKLSRGEFVALLPAQETRLAEQDMRLAELGRRLG